MNEFEERLLKHGFSCKDLQKLQQITRNTEFETSTLQSLIIDLSKRFWGGVIGGLILVIIAVYGITHSDEADLLSYFIALGFGFLVIHFVTPMRLSWKAYTFIKKNHY